MTFIDYVPYVEQVNSVRKNKKVSNLIGILNMNLNLLKIKKYLLIY